MTSIIDISKIIAGVSFILGTLILVLFLHSDKPDDFIGFGIVYILIAIIVNIITIIGVVLQLIMKPNQWKTYFKAMGILILNIPIAILYFLLVIHKLD